MELKVNVPFDWAHRGVQVESFQKGQVITTEDKDLIRVSLDEKWTSKTKRAPENKNLGDSPEDKSGAEGDAAQAPAGGQSEANQTE